MLHTALTISLAIALIVFLLLNRRLVKIVRNTQIEFATYRHQAVNKMVRLWEKIDETEAAWEQGNAELEEGYQQEALSAYDEYEAHLKQLRDELEVARTQARDYEEAYEFHLTNCLPHLSDIRLESIIEKELQNVLRL